MSDGDGDAVVANDAGAGADEGFTLFRFDAKTDIPVFSSLQQAGHDLTDYSSGGDRTELVSLMGDVADLAISGVVYAADPLNFLLSAGLGFLIDVVQPLDDLLSLVTGNPERMEMEIAKWGRVGNALGPLADEIRAAANEGLIGWTGKDATAARARLNEYADAVASLTSDVDQLKVIMGLMKTVMETAQQFLISLLATFVEWLMWTWIPALAEAAPTFGASVAAASAATEVEATVATTRGAMFIQRVAKIIMRLRLLVWRMHPTIMRRVMTGFQLRYAGKLATFAKFDIPAGKLIEDWRTWAPGAAKFGTGAVTGIFGQEDDQGGPSMSDEDQDRALSSD